MEFGLPCSQLHSVFTKNHPRRWYYLICGRAKIRSFVSFFIMPYFLSKRRPWVGQSFHFEQCTSPWLQNAGFSFQVLPANDNPACIWVTSFMSLLASGNAVNITQELQMQQFSEQAANKYIKKKKTQTENQSSSLWSCSAQPVFPIFPAVLKWPPLFFLLFQVWCVIQNLASGLSSRSPPWLL